MLWDIVKWVGGAFLVLVVIGALWSYSNPGSAFGTNEVWMEGPGRVIVISDDQRIGPERRDNGWIVHIPRTEWRPGQQFPQGVIDQINQVRGRSPQGTVQPAPTTAPQSGQPARQATAVPAPTQTAQPAQQTQPQGTTQLGTCLGVGSKIDIAEQIRTRSRQFSSQAGIHLQYWKQGVEGGREVQTVLPPGTYELDSGLQGSMWFLRDCFGSENIGAHMRQVIHDRVRDGSNTIGYVPWTRARDHGVIRVIRQEQPVPEVYTGTIGRP